MTSLLDLDPDSFIQRLRDHGGRASLTWDFDRQRLVASQPWLDELASALMANDRDFHRHEGVFLAVGPETGALFGAFVHTSVRGQAAGGLRHWPYANLDNFVRDGLRLSLGMARKNALAGLWWGGGKGIIARQPGDRFKDPGYRRALYREYGSFTTSLRGLYITAEDVGTTPPDVAAVFETTRYAISIPPSVGGSGNPSPATAKGVVCAMEAALAHQGKGTLAGKTIAMQGAGNVAAFMIEELLAREVGKVIATDITEERCAEVRARFAGRPVEVRLAAPGDDSILAEPCDILAPCALGAVLNPTTIPTIKAPIVCGAANNQLLDDRRDDQALAARGIVYVPDYVANRMGIVNCANEQYGSLPHDPAIERHFGREWDNSVFVITRAVLERAAKDGITTATAANRMADEACTLPHPIWGQRGKAILAALVAEGWGAGSR
ncbi:Glu/Leu/Phe/Val family dehydrogenase [Nannocystaceae bacterium ST9]